LLTYFFQVISWPGDSKANYLRTSNLYATCLATQNKVILSRKNKQIVHLDQHISAVGARDAATSSRKNNLCKID